VRQRVARLPAEAGEVLRWASVLGRGATTERLLALTGVEAERLLAAIEALERHELLCAADGTPTPAGAIPHAFAHEVVRQAVYADLSLPRRRLMHARAARLVEQEGGEVDAQAEELVRHAALAGEVALAARACVAAGRRSLALFANENAWRFARRGRRHAEALPEPDRTRLLLELVQVELTARRPADAGAAAAEVEALAERALDHASPGHARLGFHLLAYLRWERGAWSDAQRHMMRAELVARSADEGGHVVAMAEAARCLTLLDRDLPRAEALALEARARAERSGVRPSALADAQGMLRLHEGRLEEAAELFEEARVAARQEQDRMSEFQALEHLVVLHQQREDWREACRLALELAAIGEKLRGGSEAPFARALVALCRHAMSEDGAGRALESAFEELRLADAKHRLAYALTRAARLDLGHGDVGAARSRSEEALRLADALGRPTERLFAAATLARALVRDSEVAAATAVVRGAAGRPAHEAAVAARRAIEEALQEHPALAAAAREGGTA
jgi:hypothetical protein